MDIQMDKLIAMLERIRLDEYMDYVSNRRRIVLSHLFFGMLRGVGFAIGFSILSAFIVVILKNVVVDNIPLIGGFLAEVINAIQERL